MKVAIMQPYLFPYIGYFQLMQAVDKFILLDDVNYINKGWINRNRILVNGSEHTFTIPLVEASQNKLIRDIFISSDNAWKKKLLKTIEMSYKKAPFFAAGYGIVEKIVTSEFQKIGELIHYSLTIITEYLELKTQLIKSSHGYHVTDLKGQERILAICKKENAVQYINLIGGLELYSLPVFLNEGIRLNFLKSVLSPYSQFKEEFVPGLSIIDVVMFNPPARIQTMLSQYELI